MSDEPKHDNVDDAATAVIDPAVDDAATEAVASGTNGSLLEKLELPVEVRFGQLAWNLRRLLELRVGDAVPVGPDGDDVVTLYVQGRPFATGELVVINGRFGFRVIDIIDEGGPR